MHPGKPQMFFFRNPHRFVNLSYYLNLKGPKKCMFIVFTFLLFSFLLPFFLILITSTITGSRIRTMWMIPFYSLIGIFFIFLYQNKINYKKLKNFNILLIILKRFLDNSIDDSTAA